MIWREKRVLLIILGVLLIANTLFFFTYRVQYVERLRDLDARQEEAEARLQQTTRARQTAEQQLATLKKSQNDLQVLYTEHWATQSERFTALITEVKRLAAATQLAPPTYQFTAGEAKSNGNDDRGSIGTTTAGIAFTVQGTYEQIRRLINLLELSDQFVIIDGISLVSNNPAAGAPAPTDKTLTLSIRLKTLFRDPRVNPQNPRRQL